MTALQCAQKNWRAQGKWGSKAWNTRSYFVLFFFGGHIWQCLVLTLVSIYTQESLKPCLGDPMGCWKQNPGGQLRRQVPTVLFLQPLSICIACRRHKSLSPETAGSSESSARCSSLALLDMNQNKHTKAAVRAEGVVQWSTCLFLCEH